MNKTALIITTFLFGLSLNSMAQETFSEFKILTYNIYHGENPDSLGTANLEEIANLIISLQPDMVALQEMDSMTTRLKSIYGEKINWIAELGNKTGYSNYFAKAMNYAEGGYGEGVLVKNPLNYTTQALPTPAGGEPRAVAWAQLELENRQKLYFGATHLCHQFPENRIAQLEAVMSYSDSLSSPVIWAGDLNFDPTSEEYKSISSRWSDAGSVAKDNSPTYVSENGKRIDYVWYDSEHFELVNYKVIDVPFSDHYPVLVTLRLIKPYK